MVSTRGRVQERSSWCGHTAAISGFSCSADGTVAATCDENGEMRCHSLSPNGTVRASSLSSRDVVCVAVQKQGRVVVAGRSDGTVCKFVLEYEAYADVVQCQLAMKCFNSNQMHSQKVLAISIHEDRVISGSRDGIVCLWSIAETAEFSVLQRVGIGLPVCAVALNEQLVCSAGCKRRSRGNGCVYVWEYTANAGVIRFNSRCTLRGHSGRIGCVTLQKCLVFTNATDGFVRVWDCSETACGLFLRKLPGGGASNSLTVVREMLVATRTEDDMPTCTVSLYRTNRPFSLISQSSSKSSSPFCLVGGGNNCVGVTADGCLERLRLPYTCKLCEQVCEDPSLTWCWEHLRVLLVSDREKFCIGRKNFIALLPPICASCPFQSGPWGIILTWLRRLSLTNRCLHGWQCCTVDLQCLN